jgi:hypothetical protein
LFPRADYYRDSVTLALAGCRPSRVYVYRT